MVFDALIGEQDRHEENWGIIVENGEYRLSPLYDNGYNLLCEFYDENYAKKYYEGIKSFTSYIKRSKASIYNQKGRRFGHFDLVKELYRIYPCETKKEINNLTKLSDDKINGVVNKVPNEIITKIHKEYIINYVIQRKNILMEIIKKGSG